MRHSSSEFKEALDWPNKATLLTHDICLLSLDVCRKFRACAVDDVAQGDERRLTYPTFSSFRHRILLGINTPTPLQSPYCQLASSIWVKSSSSSIAEIQLNHALQWRSWRWRLPAQLRSGARCREPGCRQRRATSRHCGYGQTESSQTDPCLALLECKYRS